MATMDAPDLEIATTTLRREDSKAAKHSRFLRAVSSRLLRRLGPRLSIGEWQINVFGAGFRL
jgi:hypothetical protein